MRKEVQNKNRFVEYSRQKTIKDLGQLRAPIAVKINTTIREVIELYNKNRTGSVLVYDKREKIIGIFTERDLLQKILNKGISLDETIEPYISKPVKTVDSRTTLGETIKMMTEGGFRHLPVVEGERAVAVLSCGTLIRHISEVYPGAVFNLPPKFDQKFDTPHGA